MSIFDQLNTLSPGALAAFAALAGAAGAIVAAIIGKIVVTPLLSARDRQDREAEWRMHAIELTKLDLERKLKSGRDFQKQPLRPSILDFLANYRDLQELGSKSPKDLYEVIGARRIKQADPAPELAKSADPLVPES
jgi:hypothetical protein